MVTLISPWLRHYRHGYATITMVTLLSPWLHHYHHGYVTTILYIVIKTRLQLYNSPYRGLYDCIVTTLRTEGVRAFYRSYTTQLTMNIPFQSVHFITYELMQDALNQARQYNPSTHVVSGAVAGGVAAALTTPLDVCKTLLNSQEDCICRTRPVNSLVQAFRTVYAVRGARGFLAGLQARVIYQMPSTAICWSVYEFFKYFLTKHNLLADDGYTCLSTAAAAAPTSSLVVTQTE